MARTIRSPKGIKGSSSAGAYKGAAIQATSGGGGSAAAKKYTDESIAGISGALAGKNCTIQSKTAIAGGTRIVFAWTADDGTSRTDSLDVMNGTDGRDGADAPSITAVTLLADNSLRVTLSDGSHYDTTPIPTIKGDKGDDGESGADGFSPQITVEEDTTSNYILRIKTADDEFLTPNLKGQGGGGGSGDVSGVKGEAETTYRKGDVNISLPNIAVIGANLSYDPTTKILDAKAQKIDVDDEISASSENPVQNKVVKAALDAQKVTVDSALDADSENPVQNKAVKEAVDKKQDVLQYTTMPSASELPQKVVQYIGDTTANFTRGLFYRSEPKVVSGSLTYEWKQIDVQPSNRNYEDLDNLPTLNGIEVKGDKTTADFSLQGQLQYETLPSPTAAIVGKIVEFTGASTAEFKNGYFYQVQYDAESAGYKWVQVDVSSNAALQTAVTALQVNQGDITTLEVADASTIVGALNKLNAKEIKSITYVEPDLTITYKDDTTFTFAVTTILNETQVGELADVLDTTKSNGSTLMYDTSILKYKPYDILTALSNLLTESKEYTDEKIAASVQTSAYVVDQKPSYDATNDVVIYFQNGEGKTTSNTDSRFYYTVDGTAYSSSWVGGIEFSYAISTARFEDYVNKNTDITSTYSEDLADKGKVPDVAALDALLAVVKEALALKVNSADIVDGLTSQDATKVLSAKQGYVLKELADTKQDILQYTELPPASSSLSGRVCQFVGNSAGNFTKGHFYVCKYNNETDSWYWEEVPFAAATDSELSPTSENPVQNKVVKVAIDLKQNAELSSSVTVGGTAESTVEGALGALATVTDDNATAISDNADAITAESTAREEADNSLQLQLTKDHAVNVTLYSTEADKPTAIDFENGIVTSVGASAYVLATKKWYRCTAIDTTTLAITWEEFDGLGSKLVAGNGISIGDDGAISSDVVEFHGTHDEWDSLSASEQAKYNARDFTDDVDDDDTLQAEIEELQGDVSTLNAYPKIYSVYGQILTSDSAMRGNGTATVTLFANKTCRIEFSAKITTAGTNASQFNCGLSSNMLKSLNSNIPTITPVKGGVVEWYNTDGIRDKDNLGYGGILEASSGQPYWKFARMYQTSGTTGSYPETECTVGKCYIGTAYGTWA